MTAKLGDFGLARFAPKPSPEKPSKTKTLGRTATIRGTLAYLPLEYVRNGKLGTVVDVYSFGVVRPPLWAAGPGRRWPRVLEPRVNACAATVVTSCPLVFQVLLEVLTGRRALEEDRALGPRYLVRGHLILAASPR